MKKFIKLVTSDSFLATMYVLMLVGLLYILNSATL